MAAPFADAASSKEVIEEVRQERLERLEHDILQVRGLQCHATVQDVKQQYTERLAELIGKYKYLSGQYPRVPGCDEV
jgi:membrane carboxypeptidase/penicillin-binding protein